MHRLPFYGHHLPSPATHRDLRLARPPRGWWGSGGGLAWVLGNGEWGSKVWVSGATPTEV